MRIYYSALVAAWGLPLGAGFGGKQPPKRLEPLKMGYLDSLSQKKPNNNNNNFGPPDFADVSLAGQTPPTQPHIIDANIEESNTSSTSTRKQRRPPHLPYIPPGGIHVTDGKIAEQPPVPAPADEQRAFMEYCQQKVTSTQTAQEATMQAYQMQLEAAQKKQLPPPQMPPAQNNPLQPTGYLSSMPPLQNDPEYQRQLELHQRHQARQQAGSTTRSPMVPQPRTPTQVQAPPMANQPPRVPPMGMMQQRMEQRRMEEEQPARQQQQQAAAAQARQQEEQRRQEQAHAEEQRRREQQARVEEQRRQEHQARAEADRRRHQEQARQEQEQKRVAQQARAEQERREEEQRLAEQAAVEQERRQEEQRLAEQARLEEERRRQEVRMERERLAQERQLQQELEQKRLQEKQRLQALEESRRQDESRQPREAQMKERERQLESHELQKAEAEEAQRRRQVQIEHDRRKEELEQQRADADMEYQRQQKALEKERLREELEQQRMQVEREQQRLQELMEMQQEQEAIISQRHEEEIENQRHKERVEMHKAQQRKYREKQEALERHRKEQIEEEKRQQALFEEHLRIEQLERQRHEEMIAQMRREEMLERQRQEEIREQQRQREAELREQQRQLDILERQRREELMELERQQEALRRRHEELMNRQREEEDRLLRRQREVQRNDMPRAPPPSRRQDTSISSMESTWKPTAASQSPSVIKVDPRDREPREVRPDSMDPMAVGPDRKQVSWKSLQEDKVRTQRFQERHQDPRADEYFGPPDEMRRPPPELRRREMENERRQRPPPRGPAEGPMPPTDRREAFMKRWISNSPSPPAGQDFSVREERQRAPHPMDDARRDPGPSLKRFTIQPDEEPDFGDMGRRPASRGEERQMRRWTSRDKGFTKSDDGYESRSSPTSGTKSKYVPPPPVPPSKNSPGFAAFKGVAYYSKEDADASVRNTGPEADKQQPEKKKKLVKPSAGSRPLVMSSDTSEPPGGWESIEVSPPPATAMKNSPGFSGFSNKNYGPPRDQQPEAATEPESSVDSPPEMPVPQVQAFARPPPPPANGPAGFAGFSDIQWGPPNSSGSNSAPAAPRQMAIPNEQAAGVHVAAPAPAPLPVPTRRQAPSRQPLVQSSNSPPGFAGFSDIDFGPPSDRSNDDGSEVQAAHIGDSATENAPSAAPRGPAPDPFGPPPKGLQRPKSSSTSLVQSSNGPPGFVGFKDPMRQKIHISAPPKTATPPGPKKPVSFAGPPARSPSGFVGFSGEITTSPMPSTINEPQKYIEAPEDPQPEGKKGETKVETEAKNEKELSSKKDSEAGEPKETKTKDKNGLSVALKRVADGYASLAGPSNKKQNKLSAQTAKAEDPGLKRSDEKKTAPAQTKANEGQRLKKVQVAFKSKSQASDAAKSFDEATNAVPKASSKDQEVVAVRKPAFSKVKKPAFASAKASSISKTTEPPKSTNDDADVQLKPSSELELSDKNDASKEPTKPESKKEKDTEQINLEIETEELNSQLSDDSVDEDVLVASEPDEGIEGSSKTSVSSIDDGDSTPVVSLEESSAEKENALESPLSTADNIDEKDDDSDDTPIFQKDATETVNALSSLLKKLTFDIPTMEKASATVSKKQKSKVKKPVKPSDVLKTPERAKVMSTNSTGDIPLDETENIKPEPKLKAKETIEIPIPETEDLELSLSHNATDTSIELDMEDEKDHKDESTKSKRKFTTKQSCQPAHTTSSASIVRLNFSHTNRGELVRVFYCYMTFSVYVLLLTK